MATQAPWMTIGDRAGLDDRNARIAGHILVGADGGASAAIFRLVEDERCDAGDDQGDDDRDRHAEQSAEIDRPIGIAQAAIDRDGAAVGHDR